MNDELACWRCGTEVEKDLPRPFPRRAECRACGAELHVCRMCLHYDTSVSRSCRETVAEEVAIKDRANFCGWFMPRPGLRASGGDPAATEARARLDALFGGPAPASPAAGDAERAALEDLFRPREPDDGSGR
jgi:hypothetical protein